MASAETDETQSRPDPDDPRKPDSPTDLTKPSLLYVLRKTAREFQRDQCTDLAAALTYYAVLSLFPALLVVVSLLGVFGQGQRTTDAVLEIVAGIAPSSAVDTAASHHPAARRVAVRRVSRWSPARWARFGRRRATSARSAGR